MTTAAPPESEKRNVALWSFVAGVALSLMKLAGGLLTGSLGLMSEAAHSGLDAFASLITLISVRVAARPPDSDHPYGHGRFENLSATIQGLLLFGTAGAIIYESVRRLLRSGDPLTPSPWAFLVIAIGIVVDIQRTRVLSRAARKHGSRALEADALNFRADFFSSIVVLAGLALAAYGKSTGTDTFLLKADAAAALIVALLIMTMAGRLAVRAVNVLTDRASGDLTERMTRAAAGVPGVLTATPVRMRESGHRVFADVVVTTTRTLSFAQAHGLTERIESAISDVDPRAEVIVHIEPIASVSETTVEAIRAVALRLGVATHHEQVYDLGDALEAILHVELDPELSLFDAHEQVESLAQLLVSEVPRLRRVTSHIEASEPESGQRREVSRSSAAIEIEIRRLVLDAGHADGVGGLRLYSSDTAPLDLVLSCSFSAALPVREIHGRTERIEQALRQRYPDLGRIIIHAEPVSDEKIVDEQETKQT